MNIETFWNQAFLVALTHLPPHKAKKAADKATQLCIRHWQSKAFDRSFDKKLRWQDQPIGCVPEELGRMRITRTGNVISLVSSPKNAP